MRLVPVTALAATLLLAACGSTTGPGAASPSPSATAPSPVLAVPPADGPVTGVGTVLQPPDGPAGLCLGPVAESFPPQCEGIPVVGWDWERNPPDAQTEAGAPLTRWGTYAVTGEFDGLTFTVTDAVPLALYDTIAEPTPTPVAVPPLDAAQWEAVAQGVHAAPGLLTVDRPGDTGPVQVTVVHDDGSVQAWADAAFGEGAVVVTSALR